jgi:NADPH-dependent ferric siderophore reductase
MNAPIYTEADPEYAQFIAAETSAPWGEWPDYPEDLNGIFLLGGKFHVFVAGQAHGVFAKRRTAISQWRADRRQQT